MSSPVDGRQLVGPEDGPTLLTRRRMLGLWGVGALGLALASACGAQTPAAPVGQPAGQPAEKPAQQAGPGGFSGGGTLKVLLRSHFVPAYDTWVDKWAA